MTSDDDLDNIWQCGWYCWDAAPVNCPVYGTEGYGKVTYAMMLVLNKAVDYASEQVIYAATGEVLQRTHNTSGWQSWEWVNPPMQLGVEYRTTERYLGKPVYVKTVDFGALPSASRKSVAHGASNVEKIISAYGFETNGTAVFNIPQYASAGDFVFCFAGKELIYVDTGGDLSGWSANVIIKYTKTTD